MTSSLSASATIASLNAHFTRAARRRTRRGLPSPQVLVKAPGFEYSFGDRALPFHTASIGKLATATMIMKRIAASEFELSTPVAELLPSPIISGLFSGTGATVQHLLAHTSGAADYFGGPTSQGPNFIKLVLDQPDRTWKPEHLLSFSREKQQPIGVPGERFHYSDTGYILLGLILEAVTAKPLTKLLREQIFTPADMKNSVFWLREPGPTHISPAWLDGVEVSGFRSLTCDWAGGGIVSTLDDLARFATGLADGTLLTAEQLTLMTTPQNRFRRGIEYGLGAMQLRFEGFMPLLRGLPTPVGHIGVLGTHCFIDPETETTVVLNFHDTREMVASFRSHIHIVRQLHKLRT
ncbi:beta-lactamase family protein [Leucobacter coleopterorum]|uniref:Beta-lactamase family protein n=1 Tax=Leucobacter coleopterorum TaxID=2714933 RepID=A0ABX6JXC8_9MICO|nr:serine hydrolase domain-containing protein [Leucobacter coleopterorum]QIM18970.1 beta-lactamase family protein [Leucobacter coleopterorum]